MKTKNLLAPVLLMFMLASSGWTQTAGKPQLDRRQTRADEVCALFRANPEGYEELFEPEFLSIVPKARLTAIFTQYFSQLGRCTGVQLITPQGDNAGYFEFSFEKGFTVSVKLSVSATAPNLMDGLLLGTPVSKSSSLADIANELKTFPGETTFLVARLNNDSITPLISLNAGRELAIGSAFKLYILSELAREVNAKERKLSDVVTLDDRAVSRPSGTLQTWPDGSPLTLHTLAAFMISISDNTAADQLLWTLTRERVESVMEQTGHAKPEMNQPFLSTLEMFKLKGEPTHKAADDYLALDTAGRRRFLTEKLASIKLDDVKPYEDGKPAYIDRIEWFASSTDLCRVMNWLRQQTETNAPAAPLRDVLAINPGNGLNVSRERWSFIGFKAGSEPGVLNMTYLLQSTMGQWYAMSMSWNNTQAALDNTKLFALVQRALQIIE